MLSATNSLQANNIYGVVKDSLNQAVEVATISLFRSADTAFVKAEVTDVDGKFEFVEIPGGTYYIIVSLLGYQDYRSNDFEYAGGTSQFNLGDIILSSAGLQLAEATVVAQRPFIERRSDRLIVNVEGSMLSSGASAMDVLERSPGIIVSSNDAITIRGRSGVIFMIDGKPTPMSGADLANFLRGMPSSNIERIEIITNPSAKYDAAGNAGIIDIRLKKDKNLGTNGTVTASVAQGVYPKAGGGFSINHREKKINLFGSYNYNYRMGMNDLRLYRSFFENGQRTGAYDQRNYLKMPFNFHTGRVGVDYNITPNTIIGVLASGNLNKFKPHGENRSGVENENQELISSFRTTNESKDVWPSYSLNVNFKHTFPKSKIELSTDLDYAKFWNETDQTFTTNYYDLEGFESLPTYVLIGDLDGNLNIKSLKADFVYPITKDFKFEAGVKGSIVGADNNLQFFDKSDIDHPVFDSTISNHFIYEEKINAAYVNLSRNWTKFSIQSGLRVENTIAEGTQLINGASFERNYVNLFPSIFLNYNFTDKYSTGLSMSRRLDRPSYQQLNPFKFFLDPTTYREGNPYLNPQFTWSFEWNHTIAQRYTITLSYALTTDNITQVIGPVEGVDRVTVQTDKNLDNVSYYSLSASIPVSIGKWWNSINNISSYLGNYQGNYANTNLNDGNLVFDFNTNNTFTLGKDWSAELNFNYHSRELYAFMDLNPMWGLGAGIQKQVFKKKGTIKLAATDLFWENLPSALITFRDYTESFDVYRETRQLIVSYTHRFGDNKLAPSRRRAGGAEDEKQRAASGSQG
ncbi:MAG TPA: TonB-dependent receptor [Saprospiraceae bacterium]|nr:TonB-dependent receptor [Saprospiraceae bacterium]